MSSIGLSSFCLTNCLKRNLWVLQWERPSVTSDTMFSKSTPKQASKNILPNFNHKRQSPLPVKNNPSRKYFCSKSFLVSEWGNDAQTCFETIEMIREWLFTSIIDFVNKLLNFEGQFFSQSWIANQFNSKNIMMYDVARDCQSVHLKLDQNVHKQFVMLNSK